jgi:PPOX class probable F420-dependent enzyme
MDSKRFASEKYISLETFKKSGEAIQTPVWVVEDGGVVYVRTDPASWKAKRIRNNQRVRIAPSDMRGKPTGEWVDAQAHFVEGEEASRILELFKKKYGMVGGITDSFNRLRGRDPSAIISIR